MAVSASEGDDWKDQDKVLELVCDKVDSIVAFKQAQFQARRDAIRATLEKKEQEEAGAAAREAEQLNEESKEEKPASGDASEEKAGGDVASTIEQVQAPAPESAEDGAAKIEMKTLDSSKKLLSEHMASVGGTSKSFNRSAKVFQRVQEISEKQKIAKWEEMLTGYFTAGMQEFNAIRNLRQRVCRSLNET